MSEGGESSSIMLTLCCRVDCYDSTCNIDFVDELLTFLLIACCERNRTM